MEYATTSQLIILHEGANDANTKDYNFHNEDPLNQQTFKGSTSAYLNNHGYPKKTSCHHITGSRCSGSVLPVHPVVSNQRSQLECCHAWHLG